MEQQQTAGPILNDAMMAQIKAAFADAMKPLEDRIGHLESQFENLATKMYVETLIKPITATAREALAASKGAAIEAQEAQTRMAEQEHRFEELMHKMEEIVSHMKSTVSWFAGRLEETARRIDEHIDAVEKQGDKRDDLIKSQGKAIGELNTNAAVAEERRIQMVDAMTKLANATANQSKINERLADTLKAIQEQTAKRGLAATALAKTKSVVMKNPKLFLYAVIAVALAVIAVAGGIDVVQQLVRQASGIH